MLAFARPFLESFDVLIELEYSTALTFNQSAKGRVQPKSCQQNWSLLVNWIDVP